MQALDPISIQLDPTDPDRMQLILVGEIGIAQSRSLHLAAEELLSRDKHVLVDCSQVERLDITAIQVMLALALDLSKRGKECVVVEIPAPIGNLMQSAGL